jgi:3-oxoacyl-ACP reductase-like protein
MDYRVGDVIKIVVGAYAGMVATVIRTWERGQGQADSVLIKPVSGRTPAFMIHVGKIAHHHPLIRSAADCAHCPDNQGCAHYPGQCCGCDRNRPSSAAVSLRAYAAALTKPAPLVTCSPGDTHYFNTADMVCQCGAEAA